MDDAKKMPVGDTRTARVTAEEALAMHREGRPGKLEIRLTKPLITARDLSLAIRPALPNPACISIATPALPMTTRPRAISWP